MTHEELADSFRRLNTHDHTRCLAELAEALRSRDEAHELAARYREDVQDLLRVLGDVEGEDFPQWDDDQHFCLWGCTAWAKLEVRPEDTYMVTLIGTHDPDCRYLKLVALLRERPTLKLIGDIS